MGRRQLLVTPTYLVEMLKRHQGRPRLVTVTDTLPDDAKLITVKLDSSPGTLSLVLESSTWDDDPAWSGAILTFTRVNYPFSPWRH